MDRDAPLYPPLRRKVHDAEAERSISEFWRAHGTFRRSVAAREGARDFVFYEGPPTANGLPGVHHVMARLCKDLVCRYKTMTGHRVLRKAGWDTHGLPVERAVEKELGIQGGRRGIEEYGIERFNAACRDSVWSCKADWDEFTERIGYWVDLDDPYITYTDEYIESVWWILARFGEAGLLYRGLKVVPYCTMCGTPLSSHEVAGGYQTTRDPAITVKLKAADADEFFLTWTTTPWTLPANVALAVGEDFDYVRVRHGGETLILAEARLAALDPEQGIEVLGRVKGSELVGRRYEPLFPFLPEAERARALRVVTAPHVTLETGTGIVHMAPAFGEEDHEVGRVQDLPVFNPVDAAGRFTAAAGPYAGLHVKEEADPRIIADLKTAGRLLRKETYEHEYPFHDRCKKPLIYFATQSWFIRTSALRDRLAAASAAIRWVPPETGTGRFANWLAGNVDWSLSRNRFWGTPLNVWLCDACGAQAMPTCRADLSAWSGRDCAALDLHRPHVDAVVFPCRAGCGGVMRRTPEVIDCWFDSGSMPYAQYHYPFENRELFESQFPADFISEGIDQTRGWFYTLLVISTFLSGRSSYRSCLVHELVLDKDGKKMSKSLGNAVDPRDILREEGADALRWYLLTASPVWMPTRFDREGVKEAQRKLLATLGNVYSFYALYANLDGFPPPRAAAAGAADAGEPTLLDRWILSRLHTVTAEAREALEELNLSRAAKAIGAFVVDDVSNWYVRLSRRRFWKGEMTPDKRAAYTTLYAVLEGSLRLLAPCVPFVTEELYRSLHAAVDPDGSVHLADYPASDPARRDGELERLMAAAQEVVGLGRALRQEAALRTRQPLSRLLVHGAGEAARRLAADAELAAIVADELNVKSVAWLADPLQVVTLAAKANYRALGPRFGARAPAVAKRIAGMTPAEAAALRSAGRVALAADGETFEITGEEAAVTEAGVPPYVAASGNGFTVALDTSLTDELREEGLAREIVNRVQNLRKKSGLEVTDRIRLFVGGSPRVAGVLSRHGDRIAGETLAELAAADAGLESREEFAVDEVTVAVALARREAEPGGEGR